MNSWQKLPIKHTNWYGFKQQGVKDQFNVVQYLGDSVIKGGPTYAIYYSSNPDKSKGHKNIVLLSLEYDKDGNPKNTWVSGMDFRTFKKEAIQNGVYCLTCKYAMYSPHRHGFITCDCGKVSVDGGKDYNKVVFKDVGDFVSCEINLLTQRVKFGV